MSAIRVIGAIVSAVCFIYITATSSARPKTKFYTVDIAPYEQIMLDLSTTWKSKVYVSTVTEGSVTTYLVL